MRARAMFSGVFVVILALAGCSATTTSPAATRTPTATPIASATIEDFTAACKRAGVKWSSAAFYRIGDLILSESNFYGIGGRKMPDNTVLKPLQVPDPNDTAGLNAQFPPQPRVNPIEMGFAFAFCNASKTQAHEIDGLMARISQFTPYSGKVQMWTECDGYYTRSDPHGVVGGGCGYGISADETLNVAYPANAATGMVMSATWVSSAAPTDFSRTEPFGALPVMLPAGQSMVVLVSGAPVKTGLYTLDAALVVDHTRLPYLPAGPTALFTATPQKWTAAACLTPAMQSQIPAATTPPSYYICPVA